MSILRKLFSPSPAMEQGEAARFAWSVLPCGREGACAEVRSFGGAVLLLLADGADDAAAEIALRHLRSVPLDAADAAKIPAALNAALISASEALSRETQGLCSCAAVLLSGEGLFFSHIGDLCISLLRGGQLLTLQQAQNAHAARALAAIRSGRVDPALAPPAGGAGAATRLLGMPDAAPEFLRRPLPLSEGDVLLLTTRGLYDSLTKAELLRCLSAPGPDAAIEGLRRLARPDASCAVVARVQKGDRNGV